MSSNVKEHKRAVALVLYDKGRQHLLVVRRPPEDDLLPNVWGLPAATLRVGESYEDAAVRAGQEKLGVKIRIVGEIAEGTADRGDDILHLKEFEVEIAEGTPSVPQSIPQPMEGATQYVACKWGEPNDLVEATRKGSLCCRLYLSSIGQFQGDKSQADSSLGSE